MNDTINVYVATVNFLKTKPLGEVERYERLYLRVEAVEASPRSPKCARKSLRTPQLQVAHREIDKRTVIGTRVLASDEMSPFLTKGLDIRP